MHSDRKIPSARASDAESSDLPTRQRREAAGTSSGDIAGHSGLTANTRLGGRGSSFAVHSGPDLPLAAGHGSIPPDSSPGRVRPIFVVLVWSAAWLLGAAIIGLLCVAVFPALYLMVAAALGAL